MARKAVKRPLKDMPAAEKGVPVSHFKPIPWMATPGMYLAGRAALDEADALEVDLELKWGRDRLRLLVSTELREKFDRQRLLTSDARWKGDLEDVRREAGRMVKAWKALDKAAEAAGAQVLDPAIWEVCLEDGTVATIIKEPQLANRILAEGRKINVYTLDEIAMLLSHYKEVLAVKLAFPGAEVTKTRTRVLDPLDMPFGPDAEGAIVEAGLPIDGIQAFGDISDEIPF